MEGVAVATAEDDSAADGSSGGGGSAGGSEEIRRCNAPRAARPHMARCQKPGITLTLITEGAIAGGGGGGGHNRKNRQQRQQQQQQQHLQQHGGGKKQKKQQKWKGNKYHGGRGGSDRKDGPPRGRKDNPCAKVGSAEDISSNNGITAAEETVTVGAGGVHPKAKSGEGHQQIQSHSEPPGSFHLLQQRVSNSNPQTFLQPNNSQQQSFSHPLLQSSTVSSQQGHGGIPASSAVPSQKGKHSKQQNLSPMGQRNKRLQSASKYFLPDKRPRKECIVPPTKFLLGGNISDPLNLNSLQNESENAVTPKSSPIPTPPHYKAKIEVIIPPNINDPLHLLDPVDSVEYEMQLCSPMKRKQRPRNKRKRKSRTTTERNVDPPLLLGPDQLPPPSGSAAEGTVAGTGLEEAATAEEASFIGIGQKFAEADTDRHSLAPESFPFPEPGSSHHQHQHLPQPQSGCGGVGVGLLLQQSHHAASVGGSGPSGSGSVLIGTGGGNVAGSVAQPEHDREREKAMRNLKLDLETAGGRKRRTSESTNSTKNKIRRMDSMDKIVSPVIPQPGGWKRAHWPANAGGSGAAGSAGRNRSRTYSSASNTDEQHGDERPAERGGDSQTQENRHQSVERSDASMSGQSGALEMLGASSNDKHSCKLEQPGDFDQQDDPDRKAKGSGLTGSEAERSGTVSTISCPLKLLPASSRYHYGNYDRYYGYHSLNEFIDVRLKVFLRNPYLFRDKDVLDIGCNVGLMTIAVGKTLHTKTTTGIDVDGKLIAKARTNLANYVRIPKKVPTTIGKRAITTASATVASEKLQDQNRVVTQHPEQTQECSNVVSDAQVEILIPGEASEGERIGGSENALASQAMDEIHSTPSSTAVRLAIVTELASKSVEETAMGEHAQILEGGKQHEHSSVDPEQNTARELKHSALVNKLRLRRRRKQCVAKSHGKNHQHHHHHHHLRHGGHQAAGSGREKVEYAQYFPISFPLTMGNLSGKEYQTDIGGPENKFPHNVRFKTMNYVVKDESFINYDTQQYDLILCLSVTKWIHLNYGDMGLKIAFKRMFNHLRPGGKLILEAQNWASYKKKKKLTETIFENYKNIEFFPNRFHDYLLSPEVGFSHSYPLGIPRHLNKGFRRPIQLYIKGDFTPSQAKWSDTYHPGTPYENHRGIYTDIVTGSQTTANCIWGPMTPYAPTFTYPQPPTPLLGGGSGGGGSGSGSVVGEYACYSPYYNPRQTDSYLPSYDNIGNGHRPGSYCFASPLYSTTWSPPSDVLATSGGGGGSYRRSASNTPNSASIRSTDNDEHYYAGTAGGGSQRRHHVYPPIDVFPPSFSHDHMRSSGSFRNGGGGGGGAMTDSDSEPSSNSASQTPTRQQQFLTDDQSNSPSGHSQPDK